MAVHRILQNTYLGKLWRLFNFVTITALALSSVISNPGQDVHSPGSISGNPKYPKIPCSLSAGTLAKADVREKPSVSNSVQLKPKWAEIWKENLQVRLPQEGFVAGVRAEGIEDAIKGKVKNHGFIFIH